MVLDALISTWDLASTVLLCTLVVTCALLLFFCRVKRRQRAGCVPLRIEPGGRVSMLLVQSRKHPELWTVPAGGVERVAALLRARAPVLKDTVAEERKRRRSSLVSP